MTLFIWLSMTVLKVLFKLINFINQDDGGVDPEYWKPGTKIEVINMNRSKKVFRERQKKYNKNLEPSILDCTSFLKGEQIMSPGTILLVILIL